MTDQRNILKEDARIISDEVQELRQKMVNLTVALTEKYALHHESGLFSSMVSLSVDVLDDITRLHDRLLDQEVIDDEVEYVESSAVEKFHSFIDKVNKGER